jgi:3',5'-cyclic AMP phosphodiesterase CpdA
MRTQVRILHISDFHFDGSDDQAFELERRLAEALGCAPDVVVHTGDVTATGSDDEFGRSAELFAAIAPIPFLVVPGNRDVPELALRFIDEDDSDPDSEAWQLAKRSLASSGPMPRADALCQPAWRGNHTAFARAFGSCNPVLMGDAVCVVGLNTNRKVYEPALEAARAAFGAAADGVPRVMACHHPVLPVPDRPWESREDTARNNGSVLELALQCEVGLICTGHLHRAHTGIAGLDGRRAHVSMAPTLTFSTRKKDRGFHVVEIEEGQEPRFSPVRSDDPAVLAERRNWIVERRPNRALNHR